MTVTAQEWATFANCIDTLRGADALMDFIPRVSPKLERPDHLRQIAEFFVNAERGPAFACTSVPPQHGKTESIAHYLVWFMMRHPILHNAYVSYAIERAETVGRHMLEVAKRAGLRLSTSRAREWITPEGGGLLITGIGGPIIGYPVDGVFVVDDAHKDRFEANSPTIRETVIEYVTVTAASRLHPGSSMLVNGTRWHLQDVIGTLREREKANPIGWQFINLPAINDKGEALWAKHRPLDFLDRQRRIHGEYDFSAEYLGSPIPDGGEIFHEPERYDLQILKSRDYWRGKRILVACDPAISAKASADYSAIVVGVMAPDPSGDGFHSMDVVDFKSLQVEAPALVRELVGLQRTWQCPIAVETVGAFKGVAQSLRQIDRSLWVMELQPKGDKLVRARPVAAAWNDARIRVPQIGSTTWVDRLVREVRQFTGIGDKHDDAVDALVHCYNTLVDMLTTRRRPLDGIEKAFPLGV